MPYQLHCWPEAILDEGTELDEGGTELDDGGTELDEGGTEDGVELDEGAELATTVPHRLPVSGGISAAPPFLLP